MRASNGAIEKVKIDEKTFRQKMAEWHVELAEEKEELPPWKEQI